MKAIILAGGRGTRLAPYTMVLPKPLVPIGDMPILEVLIRQLKRCGVDEVILTVGHLANLLQAYFSDGSRYGVKITYSLESRPLGTAGPLALAPRPTESFFVLNGDVLTTLDMADLLKFHRTANATATIAMHQRKVKIDLGVIQMDGGNRVAGYIEKPTYDYMVSMGIYVFEPCVIDYITAGQYLDFPDLVHLLLGRQQTICGFPYDGYWQDLGNPGDYEQATRDFEHMRAEFLGPD